MNQSQPMRTLTSSATSEWCTPSQYVEMARDVMGSIDLDPASCAIANKHFVKARIYHPIDHDGLNRDWHGNIFLNPPYNKIGNESSAGIWADYLLHQYYSGNVDQAILLTKSVPGYHWWDNLFNGGWPGPVCITRGRISFILADWVHKDGSWTVPLNEKGKPISNISKSASSFWYIGDRTARFKTIFSQIGRVIS